MELYYAIVNIIDYHAKNKKKLDNKMKECLDTLLEHGDYSISDIADANDAGADCTSWDVLVERFSELMESGDRIAIK